MPKAIVSLGYKNIIVEAEQALMLIDVFSKAEFYERVYRGSGKPDTHHVYDNIEEVGMEIKIIPDALYRMAKLAGRPEKENR